jgi:hypothetical protein
MGTSVMKKFTGWLAGMACAGLLAACGGGGGSPGANSNGVAPSKAASVVLTASAPTIASSGLDGTEVTLVAIVKDAGGNALSGETVSFSASSGVVSSNSRTTDASGQVTEKLSVKGDATVRAITISASAGSAKSAPITVNVVNAVPTLSLTTDLGTLASAGTAGNEVSVIALVRDANNSVVPGVTVDLKVDSGVLSLTNRVTNAQGIVTEKLGTGGDPTSRAITITASVPGAAPKTTVVNVAGNKLSINAASNINVGNSADVTVKLVDSAGNAVAGAPVVFGSNANSLVVKGGGAAVTNGVGQLVLTYAASGGSADIISVKALGVSATAAITINSSTFAIKVLDAFGNVETSAAIGGCQRVAATGGPASGAVIISSSRGTVYSDAACKAELGAPLTLSGGAANAYVNATGPGVATLTASTGALIAQTDLEFLAPLTTIANISLQADPAVVAVNTAGSTLQQSTLRAVVRDGTPLNNLIKNASVAFSIITDPSGGSLSQPALVSTGADGSATVSFIAGTTATALNGVQIQAKLVGGSNAAATVGLTVSQKSLFISAGTGNSLSAPNTAQYQADYAVMVTDAAGNPVSGIKLTASVLPTTYYKGKLGFTPPLGPWDYAAPPVACPNEDLDGNGILGPNEDTNHNGTLDPGIPVTVSPSVITTDAQGRAIVSLIYPKDRARWLDVNLTIRGPSSGTESVYNGLVHLAGLGSDYTAQSTSPPGAFSPYGTAGVCSDKN